MNKTISREDYEQLRALRDVIDVHLEAIDEIEKKSLRLTGVSDDERGADWLFDYIWNDRELDYILEMIGVTVEDTE
jgi:hypothetical protein